jgi:hypothetical protein
VSEVAVYDLALPGDQVVDQGHVFRVPSVLDPSELVPAIVITPTCELHQGKSFVSTVTMLEILPFGLVIEVLARRENIPWDATQQSLGSSGGDKRKSLRSRLASLVNGSTVSVHYMPPFLSYGHGFVAFDQPRAVAVSELGVDRYLAAMRPPFREHLSTRFSAYFLRVGTEDFPNAAAAILDSFSP